MTYLKYYDELKCDLIKYKDLLIIIIIIIIIIMRSCNKIK